MNEEPASSHPLQNNETVLVKLHSGKEGYHHPERTLIQWAGAEYWFESLLVLDVVKSQPHGFSRNQHNLILQLLNYIGEVGFHTVGLLLLFTGGEV